MMENAWTNILVEKDKYNISDETLEKLHLD